MKKYFFSIILSLSLLFTFCYTAFASDCVSLKNGIYSEDGELFYYEDGVKVPKGKLNGLTDGFGNELTPGNYTVNSDFSVNIPRGNNGLVLDSDGELRYYVNNVPTSAGVVLHTDGYYYFINSFKVAVKNESLYIDNTNGLIEPGCYTIDEYGHILNPLVITSFTDSYFYERIYILLFIFCGLSIAGIFISRPRRWI